MKVIIEGFKSYKEQIATEDFSNKVNCVGNVTLSLRNLSVSLVQSS